MFHNAPWCPILSDHALPFSTFDRECSKENCTVGPSCGNRAIQEIQEEVLPVHLAKAKVNVLTNQGYWWSAVIQGLGKGLGVYLNKDAKQIAIGTTVLQYKGVIIPGSESDRLAAVYAQSVSKSGKDVKSGLPAVLHWDTFHKRVIQTMRVGAVTTCFKYDHLKSSTTMPRTPLLSTLTKKVTFIVALTRSYDWQVALRGW
jgi:hypothetical protein